MKAKVLFCYYSDGSGFKPVRVYLEKDFIQANKDYEMMCEFASDSRTWKLEDVDLNINKIENLIRMIGESNTLTIALGNLKKRKDALEEEIIAIRELQYKEREKERI